MSLPENTGYPILEVIMEDEIVHDDDHPECDDPTCPCHADTSSVDPDLVAVGTTN
jgi:hypothetical protein